MFVCKEFNFSSINNEINFSPFLSAQHTHPSHKVDHWELIRLLLPIIIQHYFDLSEIYSNKCINKSWMPFQGQCLRPSDIHFSSLSREFLMTQWLHAWNFKSFRIMSATDILWPSSTYTRKSTGSIIVYFTYKINYINFMCFYHHQTSWNSSMNWIARIACLLLVVVVLLDSSRWGFKSVSHSLSQYQCTLIVFIIFQGWL